MMQVRLDFGTQPSPGAQAIRAKRPDQAVWCGTDCIVCVWNATDATSGRSRAKLLLVGPTGTTTSVVFKGEDPTAVSFFHSIV